jgi:drug/metabolite transporter (DMT)-like permease
MHVSQTSFTMASSLLDSADAARRRVRPPATLRGVGLMVGGNMLLGTVGLFVDKAARPPLEEVFVRCAIGCAALVAFAAASGRLGELRVGRRGLRVALGSGALMVANWALFFAALQRTSIAVATLVFHVQPLWVMAWGMLFLGEARSARRVLAAGLALLGLGLAVGPAVLARPGPEYLQGLGFALLASLCYAAVTLIAKTQRRLSGFALATWQCGVGAVALAWWPWLHGLPHAAAPWLWMLGLALLPTAAAYVALYSGMPLLQAGQIAVLQFVYPITAIVVDRVAFGHRLSPLQWLGVVAMGVALWAVGRTARSGKLR